MKVRYTVMVPMGRNCVPFTLVDEFEDSATALDVFEQVQLLGQLKSKPSGILYDKLEVTELVRCDVEPEVDLLPLIK